MPTVLGLDLSLARTGCGTIHRHPETGVITPKAWIVPTKGSERDNLIDRYRRRELILDRLAGWKIEKATLVVLEGPTLGSNTPYTWDRAGAWHKVLDYLLDHRRPVAIVNPSTLKKHASGNGRASKTEMVTAMARAYPEAGVTDDNAADALGLAQMGAMHLGWLPIDRKHQAETLDVVTWPAMARVRA